MVKHIKCNNEEHPISISYYALTRLEEETGKGLTDLDENLGLYTSLFFYSLEAGYRAEKKIFDIKKEDIPFMLDECWLDFASLMRDFITELTEISQKKLKK